MAHHACSPWPLGTCSRSTADDRRGETCQATGRQKSADGGRACNGLCRRDGGDATRRVEERSNYDKILQEQCPEIANKAKPRDVITALAKKRCLGEDVQELLQLRSYFLTLETRRGSRQDTASAVNCWKQYSQAISTTPRTTSCHPGGHMTC